MTADQTARPIPTYTDRIEAAKLEAENDRLRRELADTERQRDDHYREFYATQAELSERLTELTEARADLKRVTADRDQFARTAADLLQQRNAIADDLEGVTADRRRYKDRLADLVAQRNEARAVLDACRGFIDRPWINKNAQRDAASLTQRIAAVLGPSPRAQDPDDRDRRATTEELAAHVAEANADFRRALDKLERVTADRDRLAAACALIDRELTPHSHRAGLTPGHEAIAQALAATGWPGYRQGEAQEDAPVCPAHGDAACEHCSRSRDGGDTCDECYYFNETGMHWDTCANRVRGPLAAPEELARTTDERNAMVAAFARAVSLPPEQVAKAHSVRFTGAPAHPPIASFCAQNAADAPATPTAAPTVGDAANGAQGAAQAAECPGVGRALVFGIPGATVHEAGCCERFAAAVDALGEGSADGR